ncbi:MIP18 family protein [Ceratocystis platani]|uniref:MIP18 family protein n=1 Tax=Ceratocystis fimbriata f. sp. platani TaxID=88771 RepID=A0A0F8B8P0_CERFI|nr:MIP18 family protein [Ceratocystis platani]
MASEKDNANPTVLNPSELPTRHKPKVVRSGPDSRYDDIIFSRPTHMGRSLAGETLAGSDADSRWFSATGGNGFNEDDLSEDPIDEQEIYDLISTISDPEHPFSLGQLSIVNIADIHITPSAQSRRANPHQLVQVLVEITPTITHCSLATVLGLGVRVRLEQALPPNYRVDVKAKENTHSQDDQVNKQLSDKERVAAALENQDLKNLLDRMLVTCV